MENHGTDTNNWAEQVSFSDLMAIPREDFLLGNTGNPGGLNSQETVQFTSTNLDHPLGASGFDASQIYGTNETNEVGKGQGANLRDLNETDHEMIKLLVDLGINVENSPIPRFTESPRVAKLTEKQMKIKYELCALVATQTLAELRGQYEGDLLLHRAIKRGQRILMEALVERFYREGVLDEEINRIDSMGCSPMFYANRCWMLNLALGSPLAMKFEQIFLYLAHHGAILRFPTTKSLIGAKDNVESK